MTAFKIFLFFSFLVAGIAVFSFKFYTRAEGVTLTTPAANFFIPSNNPIKIYTFDPKPKKLQNIINQYTQSYPATFGIYIKNLNTGQEISLNPDEKFEAASLYKLGVMYTIYKKASEGKLDIQRGDIQKNLAAMIEVSSNDSAYYLVDNFTSWSEITQNLQNLGLNNTTLNQDPIITTPRDIGKLLEIISNGQAVNTEASVSMLQLMLAQQKNDRIPVHLPPEVQIAHKTGELDDNIHDAGVVITPENNYVLVIMSKDSGRESIKTVMANMSFDIYNFFKDQWDNPPEIL